MRSLLVVTLLSLVPGCGLYFGQPGYGDDDICNDEGALPAAPTGRNPDTGACEAQYDGSCDSPCGACGGADGTAPGGAAAEPWASCTGACDALTETACLATADCHAAYLAYADGAAPEFVACWDMLSYEQQHTGACAQLDDWTCADHDNCASLMSGSPGAMQFASCIEEPGLTGPGSCSGPVMCNIGPPTCPTDTTPGIANGCYTGYCIPNAACTGSTPGDCYGPRTCEIAAPQCPSGTLPGIADGCYTGYCIPTGSCEPKP